ncbi:unnamed protein product [Linum trigynum]|uniref:Uncharacterized protein n=1 Tax=Linum trigynum TaxID=586398 RepID=A0AAV2E3T3_9ROSI
MSTKKAGTRIYDEDDDLPVYHGGSKSVWVNKEIREKREGCEARAQPGVQREETKSGQQMGLVEGRQPPILMETAVGQGGELAKTRSPRGFAVRKSPRVSLHRSRAGRNSPTSSMMEERATGGRSRPGHRVDTTGGRGDGRKGGQMRRGQAHGPNRSRQLASGPLEQCSPDAHDARGLAQGHGGHVSAQVVEATDRAGSNEPTQQMTARRRMLLQEESEEETPLPMPIMQAMHVGVEGKKDSESRLERKGRAVSKSQNVAVVLPSPQAGLRRLRKARKHDGINAPAENSRNGRKQQQGVAHSRQGRTAMPPVEEENLIDVPIRVVALPHRQQHQTSPPLSGREDVFGQEVDPFAASSEEEEDQCFEIRSRAKGKAAAVASCLNKNHVRQVVAAFEAGVSLNPSVDGKKTGMTMSPRADKQGDSSLASEQEMIWKLNQYGTNILEPGISGRKRDLLEVEGVVEVPPSPKKQFIEEAPIDDKVEVASQNWPPEVK